MRYPCRWTEPDRKREAAEKWLQLLFSGGCPVIGNGGKVVSTEEDSYGACDGFTWTWMCRNSLGETGGGAECDRSVAVEEAGEKRKGTRNRTVH